MWPRTYRSVSEIFNPTVKISCFTDEAGEIIRYWCVEIRAGARCWKFLKEVCSKLSGTNRSWKEKGSLEKKILNSLYYNWIKAVSISLQINFLFCFKLNMKTCKILNMKIWKWIYLILHNETCSRFASLPPLTFPIMVDYSNSKKNPKSFSIWKCMKI